MDESIARWDFGGYAWTFAKSKSNGPEGSLAVGAGSVKRTQTFGKSHFLEEAPRNLKSRNSCVLTSDLNGGLGGLEPPTSPLSGTGSLHDIQGVS
jgi:hypothetical protein